MLPKHSPPFGGGGGTQEGAHCFPPWRWLEVLADVRLVIAFQHTPAPAAGPIPQQHLLPALPEGQPQPGWAGGLHRRGIAPLLVSHLP